MASPGWVPTTEGPNTLFEPLNHRAKSKALRKQDGCISDFSDAQNTKPLNATNHRFTLKCMDTGNPRINECRGYLPRVSSGMRNGNFLRSLQQEIVIHKVK